MHAWVYKSANKPNTYLYVGAEDDFIKVPSTLLSLLGELTFVLDVDLQKRDKLALADIQLVQEKLQEQGFYLQMPPKDAAVLARIAGSEQ